MVASRRSLSLWVIATGQFTDACAEVLGAVLDTEISPELVPPGADGQVQSTESLVGPYELNDFFLHHTIRFGQRPSKVAFGAGQGRGELLHHSFAYGILALDAYGFGGARDNTMTPWGKPALGLKTRKRNKPSNRFVLRKRRRTSKRSRGGRDS